MRYGKGNGRFRFVARHVYSSSNRYSYSQHQSLFLSETAFGKSF